MSTNKLGFILAFVVMAVMAVWTYPDNPLRYLDAHGAFVVVACAAGGWTWPQASVGIRSNRRRIMVLRQWVSAGK